MCCIRMYGISMGQEGEQKRRLKALAPYQLNERLMKVAKPSAIVMHCLPAHRGEEISESLLDGPQSVVLDQAEKSPCTCRKRF